MSFIFRTVRPANIQAWIATNAAGSLKATARESWRAYLQANSGTGQSIQQMEATYLASLGKNGNSQHDRWGTQLVGTGTNKERARGTYK
jgi:hypothetical protein